MAEKDTYLRELVEVVVSSPISWDVRRFSSGDRVWLPRFLAMAMRMAGNVLYDGDDDPWNPPG